MTSTAIGPLFEDEEPAASRDPLMVVTGVLDGVLADQMETHRRAARRAVGVVDAVVLARRYPHVFTEQTGALGVEIAERAVLFDIAVRLQVTEHQVRNVAHTAETARERLPWLWRRALDGFAPFPLVEATVLGIARLAARDDADETERAASAEACRIVDAAASEWVISCTPATFRRRLSALLDRLDPRDPSLRHADALADRRVVFEDAGDGMAWLSAYLPAIDALAIKRRLTSTAKHAQKNNAECRTRDQLRTDLLTGWLRGDGTPTAVQTKIFVTIPIALLTSDRTGTPTTGLGKTNDGGTATVGTGPGRGHAVNGSTPDRCGLCGGFAEQARIVGHEPLDPLTAKQLFVDAKAFHRVITDPIRSVTLDLDRRTYRPTTAQRDYLTLQHGTCARDGCTRLALDTDLDHDHPWTHGGPTNTTNLRPLCPPDHTTRHRTRFHYRTRPDGTVQLTTPTGHTTTQPPPF